VDWLDRLTFAEIERINQKDKTNSNKMFLNIEFPQVVNKDLPIAVVYYESFGDTVVLPPESNDVVSLPDSDTGEYLFNTYR
jgi:phosphatidylinositol 3-kinase